MSTVEEVEESLNRQVARHEVLKKILQVIGDLREKDDEGADWVLEQLAEG